MDRRCRTKLAWLAAAGVALTATAALAHGVADRDAAFILNNPGLQIVPFLYLGAKHMMTGYDHLLFLAGVIFFLFRLRDVALYATLFSIGHSITLLFGVLTGVHADPFIVDAIIGLSVVYKALDNLGAFPILLGFEPNAQAAVAVFGLAHGFGLATKLQDLALSKEGLVPNIVAFNIGVEAGQFAALFLIFTAMAWWRRSSLFPGQATAANVLLLAAGFVLTAQQVAGYVLETRA